MTDPRVYVGTYAKYNSGSLEGKWLDLEEYSDIETFYAACQELHGPGEHEFMFQDFEGIPRRFVGESHLDPQVWSKWVDLTEENKVMFELYLDNVNQDGDLEEARDSFSGEFDAPEDWAAEYWEDGGMLESIPQELQNYIDYESYARDAAYNGVVFVRHEGRVWVFCPN